MKNWRVMPVAKMNFRCAVFQEQSGPFKSTLPTTNDQAARAAQWGEINQITSVSIRSLRKKRCIFMRDIFEIEKTYCADHLFRADRLPIFQYSGEVRGVKIKALN